MFSSYKKKKQKEKQIFHFHALIFAFELNTKKKTLLLDTTASSPVYAVAELCAFRSLYLFTNKRERL
jgi:hypothetical protein